MKSRIVFAMLASIVLLSSCDKFKTSTTATGEKIQNHSKGKSGKLGKEGDILTFNLIIKTSKDSVLKDSYKEGRPFTMPLQKGTFKGSFENALYHIGEGDSTTVFVSSDSLFKVMGQPNPPGIAKGSELKFIVKVEKIQSKAEIDKEIADKKALEPKTIEAYVSKNIKNAQKTADGMYYTTLVEGAGASPAQGKTVVVNYVGKFMDGKIFDETKPGQPPFEFPVGTGQVIPGWDKALMMMKKGQKCTFVIPSALAYGEQGGGPIQPNTPLVFDITLVDIK